MGLRRLATLCSAVALALAVMTLLGASPALADRRHKDDEPRTIVTTDPELDDLNSLIRLFLYSNEIDIEGLVYSASQHHYMGDPAAGIPEYRWKFGPSHIEDALDAYDRVDQNLRRHDAEFPTAAQLRSKYRVATSVSSVTCPSRRRAPGSSHGCFSTTSQGRSSCRLGVA